MNQIAERIAACGVVPVVVLNHPDEALPVAKALIAGGLPVAEVTFRTDAAEEAIRRMVKAYPDMLVGAGTVLTVDQADRALAAGAQFIVAPGFDPEIVDHCLAKGAPVFPGCTTATEVAQGVKRGLYALKFFPAEQCGGVATIKALCAAYVGVRFMPTGGVGPGNLAQYLACDKILACGGSWMVKGDLIRTGRFDEIERLTKEAVGIVRSIRNSEL
ncbi:MAG: bifunctional 4-hydroxy-2-oxoglutarate aldolase/2-dehydro-3-deoxy-phosphogluconate aldolase [Clostridia bacterium]|nr:bifunctional 4-hydroxy-2-oxoglutarate aldolase/2-dehydro-3-deoxy-phosphogluconate aldolase [Clostridia bacterium]